MSTIGDPKLSFWCLACPTRIHVETTKKLGRNEISFDQCPVCNDGYVWDLRALIDGGTESGSNDENYKVPKGTLGTDAAEHQKLIDFIVNGEAECERVAAEREIKTAQKKLDDLMKKQKTK